MFKLTGPGGTNSIPFLKMSTDLVNPKYSEHFAFNNKEIKIRA